MQLKRKDILGLQDMTAEEIGLILDTAESYKEILSRPVKKVPILRGKSICTLFYENSTRTRCSFELAAKIMSADTTSVSVSGSSIQKGESFKDTLLTLEAMGMDLFVIRHSASGAPHFAARVVKSGVVNAGDGMHEHPTQGLLDMLTIRENKGRIEGLKVLIVGDIMHSRVARSNLWGLSKMGAEVRICGPATLLPVGVDKLPVKTYTDLDEAIDGVDVVNVLRIQLERMDRGFFPSIREYSKFYGVSKTRLKRAKPDVLVMHPGPMNRGIEITPEVADGEFAVITDQVTNGVAVRMALLYLLLGGGGSVVSA
ncbi:MAG: aspartate carbamoyltransferase catalytic subunit [Armatimonadetes bacterium]|nr:aspartate carbamoyltransferase catalytic subunit [Armatimonadota bacterium]